ncbi:MAG: hypothetical protein JNM93_14450 [Bacteriovoracaceae bacterium]|nr:hypothetical protein [Bacteriovoracaceae bacterium]
MAGYNENDYFKILIDSIQVGTEVTFDTFILLKKLGRIVQFTHSGNQITAEDFQKLSSGQVTELYVKKADINLYQEYLKTFYHSDAGKVYLSNHPDIEIPSGIIKDKLERYEGQSVPTIIREIYDYSEEFKFFVQVNKAFDNVSEIMIQRCFIEIGELYKKLLIENQLLEGDHRNERLMKLVQKQLAFIHRLQIQIMKVEGDLQLEKILHAQAQQNVPTTESTETVKMLSIQVDELQNQIKTNRNIVEEAKLKISILNTFINENESYILKLETESENQMSALHEQRNQIEDSRDQAQKALATNDGLLRDLARQKEEILHLKDSVNELRIKVTSKDQELKELTQQFQSKNVDFGSVLNRKQNEVAKLENDISEKNDTIKALYKEIEKLKTSQDNMIILKKQIAEKVETVKEMKVGYIKSQDDLKGKITALKNLNEKARKTIDYLTQINDDLRKKVA